MQRFATWRCPLAVILGFGWLWETCDTAADVTGVYNPQNGVVQYSVTNLPDFDQKRGASASTVGLPNTGNMYCVPTSTMNVLAYIASHGFPIVTPGFASNWQAAVNYNVAGTAISNLGIKMNTSASNGTTKSWQYIAIAGVPGLGIPPAVPASKISVFQYFVKGSYIPRFSTMTKSAINSNGLVALCHGWYTVTGTFVGVPVLQRTGGHCLTLQKATGCDGCAYSTRLRDPIDDGSLFSQSMFVSANCSVVGRLVYLKPPPFFPAVGVSEILPTPSNGQLRILDSYLLLCTKKGYWFTNDVDGGQQVSLYNPINFTGTGLPAVQHFAIANGAGDLVDIVATPDFDGFVYIAGSAVFRLDSLSGISTPVSAGNPVAPSKVMFGRSRGLYLLDGPAIRLIDFDAEPPVEVINRWPPNPCSHQVYDDLTDRVILLSTADRVLFQYDRSLENDPPALPIPANVPLGGEVGMAINPNDGSLWVTSSTSSELWRLSVDMGGVVQAESFTLPAVQSPRAVDVDDAGNIFVSADGIVREFMIDKGAAVEVMDSPFAGLPGGPMLKLTHSRTNFEAGEHDTPEWNDVLPEDVSPSAPDCLADIAPTDGDSVVGVPDLLQVINSWGPCAGCRADINPSPDGNETVGVPDLLAVINSWGPCPSNDLPLAADPCGSSNPVEAGLHQFSTLGATTDGPALPAECDEGFGLAFGQDTWLRYVPTVDGLLTIDICNMADYDTRLAVYTGDCNDLELIGCNDDSPGCELTSKVIVPVMSGVPVRIRVGGFGAASGTGAILLNQ